MGGNLKAEAEGAVFVPKCREDRLKGRKVVIVLESACVELVHVGKGRHELLDGTRHRKLLQKSGDKRDPADLRPDIVYSCLQTLLDSPLNRIGRLMIYIRTAANLLIEVNPQLRPPLTYLEFESAFATLMVQKVVKATEAKLGLLRIVANDMAALLPPGTRRFGCEVSGEPVQLGQFVKDLITTSNAKMEEAQKEETQRVLQFGWKNQETGLAPVESNGPGHASAMLAATISDFARKRKIEEINDRGAAPICFFIGAVAKGSPVTNNPLVETTLRISQYPLSAAACCAKLVDAFEAVWI